MIFICLQRHLLFGIRHFSFALWCLFWTGFHKAITLCTIFLLFAASFLHFWWTTHSAWHSMMHFMRTTLHHHLLLTTAMTGLIPMCHLADVSDKQNKTYYNKEPGNKVKEFTKLFLPCFGQQQSACKDCQ